MNGSSHHCVGLSYIRQLMQAEWTYSRHRTHALPKETQQMTLHSVGQTAVLGRQLFPSLLEISNVYNWFGQLKTFGEAGTRNQNKESWWAEHTVRQTRANSAKRQVWKMLPPTKLASNCREDKTKWWHPKLMSQLSARQWDCCGKKRIAHTEASRRMFHLERFHNDK